MNNKVAIVTGGASGIGKEICLSLAKKGLNVVIAPGHPSSLSFGLRPT